MPPRRGFGRRRGQRWLSGCSEDSTLCGRHPSSRRMVCSQRVSRSWWIRILATFDTTEPCLQRNHFSGRAGRLAPSGAGAEGGWTGEGDSSEAPGGGPAGGWAGRAAASSMSTTAMPIFFRVSGFFGFISDFTSRNRPGRLPGHAALLAQRDGNKTN